jgi:hypothetical protein
MGQVKSHTVYNGEGHWFKPTYKTTISDGDDFVEGIGATAERAQREAAYKWDVLQNKREWQREEDERRVQKAAQAKIASQHTYNRDAEAWDRWWDRQDFFKRFTQFIFLGLIGIGFIAGLVMGSHDNFGAGGILASGVITAAIMAFVAFIITTGLAVVLRYWWVAAIALVIYFVVHH